MLEELRQYYRSVGIAAEGFACPYYPVCSSGKPNFTTAKEPFVSTGYVEHTYPRVLFISLDSGSAETDPTRKTLSAVRQHEEFSENVLALPKNKHWYRTHELAQAVLNKFAPDLPIDQVRHYFAHMNSAKCCENNPGRAQAGSTLFDNCRGFIPREIEILAPDVLISQGAFGKAAVNGAFAELEKPAYFPADLDELMLIQVNGRAVIWLHTYHPRNGSFHTRNRANLSVYTEVIRAFLTQSPMQRVPVVLAAPPAKPPVKRQGVEMVHKMDDDLSKFFGKVKGYIEITVLPKVPADKFPSQAACEGYEFMTMVQLCNLSEKYGQGRPRACNAFGGDKGALPVIPERQAYLYTGNEPTRVKKFVKIKAVAKYFDEVGIPWR